MAERYHLLSVEFARVVDEIARAQRDIADTSASIKITADKSRALIAESHELMRRADALVARR